MKTKLSNNKWNFTHTHKQLEGILIDKSWPYAEVTFAISCVRRLQKSSSRVPNDMTNKQHASNIQHYNTSYTTMCLHCTRRRWSVGCFIKPRNCIMCKTYSHEYRWNCWSWYRPRWHLTWSVCVVVAMVTLLRHADMTYSWVIQFVGRPVPFCRWPLRLPSILTTKRRYTILSMTDYYCYYCYDLYCAAIETADLLVLRIEPPRSRKFSNIDMTETCCCARRRATSVRSFNYIIRWL